MKAFVTGSTGFLGANLVAGLLDRGIKIRALCRDNSPRMTLAGLGFEEVRGDVFDRPDSLVHAIEGCEWVFHVAGRVQYSRSPDELYRVNVEGTRNVLRAARKTGVTRFVHTSSISALGVSGEPGLLTEESEFNLRAADFPYGHSKYLAEVEVHKAIDAGLEAVIVNPATMFGPRDVHMNAGSMIIQAAKGRMRFFPPGGSNFIAVRDVVEGHIAAAEKGGVGERYILGFRNLTYRDVFAMVCRVLRKPEPRYPIPRPVLRAVSVGVGLLRGQLGLDLPVDANQVLMSMQFIFANSSKAIRELQLPQTPLEPAIEEAYRWYLANGLL